MKLTNTVSPCLHATRVNIAMLLCIVLKEECVLSSVKSVLPPWQCKNCFSIWYKCGSDCDGGTPACVYMCLVVGILCCRCCSHRNVFSHWWQRRVPLKTGVWKKEFGCWHLHCSPMTVVAPWRVGGQVHVPTCLWCLSLPSCDEYVRSCSPPLFCLQNC